MSTPSDRYSVGERGPELLTLPFGARLSDPPTSHAAARSISPHLNELRRAVLEPLAHLTDATAYELWTVLRPDHPLTEQGSVRTRLSDMARLGWVEDTGRTRPGASGRAGIVWRITPAGRERLAGR